MKDGTLILSTSGRSSKWYARLVIWLIRKAAGSDYDHTRGSLGGVIYETRHPDGYRKSIKDLSKLIPGRAILTPKVDLTPVQVAIMTDYWEHHIAKGSGYNYKKLFLSLLIPWTRFFWHWIKWVPWHDSEKHGDHCSGAWDECYKLAGMDILKKKYEEITAPGDLLNNDFFDVEVY